MSTLPEYALIFSAFMDAVGDSAIVDQTQFNGKEFVPPGVTNPLGANLTWWRPMLDPDESARAMGVSRTAPSERGGALVIQHFAPLASGMGSTATDWNAVRNAFHRKQIVSVDGLIVINFGDAPLPRKVNGTNVVFSQTNARFRYSLQDLSPVD